MGVVGADAHLHGHGHVAGGGHGRRHHAAEQHPVHGQGRTAALAGHLGHRAPEVEVDVVGTHLVDQPVDGGAHGHGIGPVELHAVVGGAGLPGHEGLGPVAALDQAPGVDHLGHEQPAAERPAHGPERRVGHPGHGRQHDRRVDGDGSEVQGCHTGRHRRAGARGGGHAAAHRSVMGTPRRASRVRSSGRDRPMTLLWSPSMPSMNGADRPSRVMPPATPSGSPVAT